MPGFIRSENETWKIHWLTTWYVAPEYRKTSLAVMLILHAIRLKYDLVVCGVIDEAEKIYRGLGFRRLGELDYSAINLRASDPFNLTFRGIRKIFRKLECTIEIPCNIIRLGEYLYSPLKKLLYKGLFAPFMKELDSISWKQADEIAVGSEGKKQKSDQTLFYRDHQIINWMMEYKWIENKDDLEEPDLKYFFSELFDVFQYIAVKIYSLGWDEYKGFLVLSFSKKKLNSHIKVLDYHFYNQDDCKYVLPLTLRYAYLFQANYIEMPCCFGNCIQKILRLRPFLRRMQRRYYFYSRNNDSGLDKISSNIKLNYCDGDMAFT
jgi:hypothetical protein